MVTKEEIRELMKDNFEEISCAEYSRLNYIAECKFSFEDGNIYFKPKEKYPKVFENKDKKVVVYVSGGIDIIDKSDNRAIIFIESLPILYEAVELSKKLNKLHSSEQ